MAAGIEIRLWLAEDVVALVDARSAKVADETISNKISPPHTDYRRGVFRIWIVLSFVWSAAISIVALSEPT
jgi:hypothetical protein